MRFCAYYVLRAAGAQSFAPLEKARVVCGELTASHRDGGFYVFLSPLPPGAEITVSCPGYSPALRSSLRLRQEMPRRFLTAVRWITASAGRRYSTTTA